MESGRVNNFRRCNLGLSEGKRAGNNLKLPRSYPRDI